MQVVIRSAQCVVRAQRETETESGSATEHRPRKEMLFSSPRATQKGRLLCTYDAFWS